MRIQIVCTCYRPPNGSSTTCMKELSDSMDHISDRYDPGITLISTMECKMIMYADVTVLYTSTMNSIDVQASLSNNLDRIFEWCRINRLTINVGKTKHIVIGQPPVDDTVVENNVYHNNQKIELVSEYTYLGV